MQLSLCGESKVLSLDLKFEIKQMFYNNIMICKSEPWFSCKVPPFQTFTRNKTMLLKFAILQYSTSSDPDGVRGIGLVAKKGMYNSAGLLDFAILLVNSVVNLPDGQVNFLGEFKLQKNCTQSCKSKTNFGVG